jgi:hypothetical protein
MMNKAKNNIVTSIYILIFVGLIYFTWRWYCWNHPPYSPEINAVLFMAGDNRPELEKVLKHYSVNPDDSLKLKAAEFLIVNMPGKYSKYYDAPWNDVATVYLRWTSSSNKQRALDTYKLGEQVIREDVKYITAEYLTNNIELSFKVWQERPWGKHIPFDIFCEDILPYRINAEPLENWREKALVSFADLDTVLNKPATTSVEACRIINDILPRLRPDYDFPVMNFSQTMASARGSCNNMTSLAVFSMRALGIPVTVEITPRWTDLAMSHSWNAVHDSSGKYVSFMGTESNPYIPHQGTTRLKSKAFRKTFAVQKNLILTEEHKVPPLLRGVNILKDVSANYDDCTDTVTVRLRYSPETPAEYVYLAFCHEGMHIVAWTSARGSTAKFASIGGGILYFPVYYTNNRHTAAGDPFWLDTTGNVAVLPYDSPDTLATFTGIAPDDNFYPARMLNGVFEGANKPDFSDAKILHTVKNVPEVRYNEVILKTPVNYRYVRYKSPLYSRCNVAEIEFYSSENEKLSGTHTGTPGSWDNSGMSGDKAFDNDVTTCYNAIESDTAWTGLDFHERKHIYKIRYFPRTNGDNIYKGHHYELFYMAKTGWRSAGRQTASDDNEKLQYHVPSLALMYLHNKTLNRKGKMFFISSDSKIYWI